jgi:hypothetical protein
MSLENSSLTKDLQELRAKMAKHEIWYAEKIEKLNSISIALNIADKTLKAGINDDTFRNVVSTSFVDSKKRIDGDKCIGTIRIKTDAYKREISLQKFLYNIISKRIGYCQIRCIYVIDEFIVDIIF